MKIKRFFAADMHQTMQQVRAELGSEAVILSNREVDGGVEIICAIDLDCEQDLNLERVSNGKQSEDTSRRTQQTEKEFSAVAKQETKDEPASSSSTELPLQTVERSSDSSPANKLSPEAYALQELQRELTSMKGLLNNQLSHFPWAEDRGKQTLSAQHVKRLTDLGFSPKLARKIADSVQEVEDEARSWREVLYRLAEHIPVTGDDLIRNGGIVMLVGPTGVGKTTTVAKLATRYVLQNGCDQVALITTDTVGVGEEKQLQTYGQLINVPVFMASKDELSFVLEGLSDKRLILIDTAGMNPRDPRICKQFHTLSNAFPLKIYLALSANTQRIALDEVVRAFGLVGLKGCIVTKVDEALSFGDVLSVVIRHRLPLAYVSDGRRIPEDLHRARTTDMLARALSLAQRFEKPPVEEDPPPKPTISQTPHSTQDEIWYLSPSPVENQSSGQTPSTSSSDYTGRQKKQ